MSKNTSSLITPERQQPHWKVSLEGNGHYSLHRAGDRGWGYTDYAFTIEQAIGWLASHADDGDTTVWEI